MRKKVVINTSMFALYGNHIYVSIRSEDNHFEYRARNPLDAKSFIEHALERHFAGEDFEIFHEGDIAIHFVYHRAGD